MAGDDRPFPIRDCRGGQNSADPPIALGPTQVVSASNVEWYRGTVARKRRGSRLVERDAGSALPTNVAFTTLAGVPRLSGSRLGVVIEAADFAWYAWGFGGTPADFSSAGSAPDTPASNAALAYFNGRWFAAYNSSVDRLHYLSITDSGANWYRAGLAVVAAPVITESAGAVTDNRKYRSVVYYNAVGGPRSEPSAETAVKTLITEQASGAGPGNAPANELYNQWELQAASDDDNYATWWVIGNAGPTVAIVDNNTSLFGLEPANELGLFETQISYKYLGVDDNRLLGAGAYEDTTDEAVQQRVWFTPVLGDRDEADSERVPDLVAYSNWVDVDAGDGGGPITAFGPATLGDILVFKTTQLWRLVRTGILEKPYLPRPIDKQRGTFGFRTVCAGADETGQPAVYFASQQGPCRVGVNGVQYLGTAIEDVWARVNQHGNTHYSQHAVYYGDRGQYWLWVSIDGATVPSVLLVYTVRTGAWASYTGVPTSALCSAILPRYINEDNKGITTANVLTAPSVPYCCPNTVGRIIECDAINPQTGVALDTDAETYSGSGSVWTDGTAYAGSVTTAPLEPKALDSFLTVTGGTVVADAASGVSVSVTLIPDFDTSRQRVATALLTPVGSQTIVVKRPDGCQFADARYMQAQLGDASPVASQWNIIAAELRVKGAADR
jgi:hypothetical protein